MVLDYLKIGTRIKKARIDKKLTQAKLAEQLELSNNYISGIECGKAVPSLETFVMICNALDVTAEEIADLCIFKAFCRHIPEHRNRFICTVKRNITGQFRVFCPVFLPFCFLFLDLLFLIFLLGFVIFITLLPYRWRKTTAPAG